MIYITPPPEYCYVELILSITIYVCTMKFFEINKLLLIIIIYDYLIIK